MVVMSDGMTIECATCVAASTTACADCVVGHLLANEDGPIEYVAVPVGPPRSAAERAVDRAVELFVAAGLVDAPVQFVDPAEFEHGSVVGVPA